MSDIITAPPIPAWLQGSLPSADYQVRFLKPNGEQHFASNPGPQTWGLLCPYQELLTGGRRGGGKSVWLMAWMAMGDSSLPDGDPAKFSFLNDPDYRGLILRKEYQSLVEFVDKAIPFFREFGGDAKDDPVVFKFPSGAKIYTNHLNNEESYEKYRGMSITRIGIEELTQIPTERQYLKLLGSLRSVQRVRGKKVYPPLRTQIASTTNPDGVGREWVKSRFVRVLDGKGKPIEWNTPTQDPISRLTRIFIPFPLEANPYFAEGTAAGDAYRSMLMAQDDVTRKQWMEGDWDAGSGIFFGAYRPDGPKGQEEADKYPWANHRTDPVELKPWWYRWIGFDWGFQHNSVAVKFCRNEQDRRIHVYDELSVRQVGSYELGVLLANWCLPELEQLPDHQITVYMSPDAFSKTDAAKTKAEQMANGIQEILGPYGAVLMRYTDDERVAASRNPAYAKAMFERRVADAQGSLRLVLKPANTDRIAGWSYIQELLRWRPVLQLTQEQITERLRATYQQSGVEAYEEQLAKYKKLAEPEVLPKLLIWKHCTELDRCLREAQHDDPPRSEDVRKWDAVDGVGGEDALDAFRHAAMAYKEIETVIPKMYFVEQRIQGIQDQHKASYGEEITDPTRLAMIRATQDALYRKQHAPGAQSITLPRAGSLRHRSRVN